MRCAKTMRTAFFAHRISPKQHKVKNWLAALYFYHKMWYNYFTFTNKIWEIGQKVKIWRIKAITQTT